MSIQNNKISKLCHPLWLINSSVIFFSFKPLHCIRSISDTGALHLIYNWRKLRFYQAKINQKAKSSYICAKLIPTFFMITSQELIWTPISCAFQNSSAVISSIFHRVPELRMTSIKKMITHQPATIVQILLYFHLHNIPSGKIPKQHYSVPFFFLLKNIFSLSKYLSPVIRNSSLLVNLGSPVPSCPAFWRCVCNQQ